MQEENGLVDGDYRLKSGGGWLEVRASVIIDRKGDFRATLVQIREITARKVYEQELKQKGYRDALTGVYNRAYFEDALSRLGAAQEYPVALISADLDGLKLVNDVLGHYQGDRLLLACANVLRSSLRQSDLLARIGGDEFAIILTGADNETAEKVIGRVAQNAAAYNREQPFFPLSISLGMVAAAAPGVPLQQLFHQADERMYSEKLSRSPKREIVAALLAALRERGLAPEGQAARLEALCRRLGQMAGLSPRRLERLALLARVHNLGYVGVPDHILFKSGTLSPEERETLRLHPEKGYRIAASSPNLTDVAELILKHHERWDATGYPQGLKGEEIPLECRIFSIAEAYDSIISQRPHRQARNKQEALAELGRCAGTQFDPRLTALFLQMVGEGE